MTYSCTITHDYVYAFKDGVQVAKFDYNDFMQYVISPKEFEAYFKNPDKKTFNIRRIELNLYKL